MRRLRTDHGLFNGVLRDGNAGEGVHSTLHRIAADALHSVENLLCECGLLC